MRQLCGFLMGPHCVLQTLRSVSCDEHGVNLLMTVKCSKKADLTLILAQDLRGFMVPAAVGAA